MVPRRTGPGEARAYDPAVLLAIDVGNSNLTVGSFRNGQLIAVRRAATPRGAPADQVEVLLASLLALDGTTLGDVSSLAVASVVPRVTSAIESVAARRAQPVLVASAGTIPLPIRTDRPAEVGPDRLINALAAARLHGAPAVVVDLGTATTFDCVGPDGAFLGGAIAPGVGLGLDALAGGTAMLPRADLRAPERAIGRDTASAIQAGTVLGHAAMVAGLLGRLRREVADAADVAPESVTTVLTGGYAGTPWAATIEGVDVVDPDLTLKGLAILHAEVAGGQPLRLELP